MKQRRLEKKSGGGAPRPAAAPDVLSTLTYAPGSRKRVKRIGRGQGSGHGGTATRGHKGEGARSGTHFRPWFEGGQMPLIRRVPKFGFHSPFRVEYQVVNLGRLAEAITKGRIAGADVTPEKLHAVGLISRRNTPVKILGVGEPGGAISISAHAFSKSAVTKIEAAGGKASVISNPAANRPKSA